MPSGVVPTEEDVLAWARAWPGMPTAGIPPAIPDAWVLGWFEYRTRAGQPPLADWRREAALRFRSDWMSGHPRARQSGPQRKGAAAAPVESATARRIRLEGDVKRAASLVRDREASLEEARTLATSGHPGGAALRATAEQSLSAAESDLASAQAALLAAGEEIPA